MKEGIIQKVFNEYLSEKLSNVSFYDKFIKQTLKDVEQELIAEVKRECIQLLGDYGKWNVITDMQYRLIGDTE
jgi:hypothetical protein